MKRKREFTLRDMHAHKEVKIMTTRFPEKMYYEPIKTYLIKKFNEKVGNCYLENTHAKFSQKIKREIPEYREIIFSFLKKEKPDLTGYVKKDHSTDFITVEIKNDPITLEDIYQAKRYADLFQAKYGFLIFIDEIETEIKRLHKRTYILRTTVGYNKIVLGQWDQLKHEIIDWYEESPF